MPTGRMSDRVALVTGGGTGIGRSVALRCAAEGAKVAINYRRSQKEAEATLAEIEKLGGTASLYRADVAHEAEVRTMFSRVAEELGPVEFLVNSAGMTKFIAYEELDALTESVWDEILATNLKGAFFCARAAVEQMHARGRGGSIVSVASTAGITGRGSSIAYAASKGALINLTKGLALAVAPHIRVNAVAPGVVETRWTDGWDDFKERSRGETPLGRNATVDDVSEVILSLLLSASFVTGQTVVVDGGRRM